VREDADPDAADALDVARDGAARRLDLARGDAPRRRGLEAEIAEIERRAALGLAMDAALMRLAVLGALRLEHVPLASSNRQARACCCSAARLSCAIGSCASTSPLNTHTLTPQVP